MFETISRGFSNAKNLLRKQTILNENNIAEALKEVKMSLLEADVEYNVVKSFTERVKERAIGQLVKTSLSDKRGKIYKLSPSEHFVGICYEELLALMGPSSLDLVLKSSLTSFMMVGLQGCGKTTTSAKLARFLKEEKKKTPLLVAADIYRPGAAHQLQVLGNRLDVPVFHLENVKPQEICERGISEAKRLKCDVVIFDTAGRLSIDEELMTELDEIKLLVNPDHVYLVVDAMIGQDAVMTAKLFDNRLDVSGFILTKLDGDARGGAAISIKEVTKKPIKFLGMGEDLQSLEPFRPEGLASRILGMGDVVSLAKDFEKHVDENEAEEDVKRLIEGSFTFDDFLKQLKMMRKIGSFQSIIERLPFMQEMLPQGAKIDEREFQKVESMVFSMTNEERSMPELFTKHKNRRIRVANGSGRRVEDLDQVLKNFMLMRQMMSMVGKNPQALSQLPMFKNIDRAAQIAKTYGKDSTGLMDLIGAGAHPFNLAQEATKEGFLRPKISMKDKKDKRKLQKLARKKSKKRK